MKVSIHITDFPRKEVLMKTTLHLCLQGAETIIFQYWACKCTGQKPVILQTQIHKTSLILTADCPACLNSIDDHIVSHDISHVKACCNIGFMQRNCRLVAWTVTTFQTILLYNLPTTTQERIWERWRNCLYLVS